MSEFSRNELEQALYYEMPFTGFGQWCGLFSSQDNFRPVLYVKFLPDKTILMQQNSETVTDERQEKKRLTYLPYPNYTKPSELIEHVLAYYHSACKPAKFEDYPEPYGREFK